SNMKRNHIFIGFKKELQAITLLFEQLIKPTITKSNSNLSLNLLKNESTLSDDNNPSEISNLDDCTTDDDLTSNTSINDKHISSLHDHDGYIIAIEANHWGGCTTFSKELLHSISEYVYTLGIINEPFIHTRFYTWK